MQTIKLTEQNSQAETLVNLDNVMYIQEAKTAYGKDYTSVYFSQRELMVQEKVSEIADALERIN